MNKIDSSPTIARYRSLSKTIYADNATVILPPTIIAGKTVKIGGTQLIGKTIIVPSPENPAPIVESDDKIELTLNDLHDLIQHKTHVLLKFLKPRYFLLEEGKYYDGYQIIGKIGEGTFAKVYKVANKFKSDYYVFKVLHAFEGSALSKKDFLNRYKFEFKVGQINSKYLLQSYQKGFINGNPYIVFEYADGGALHKVISENISLAIINKIASDVLNGLASLHDNGIIHRDVKPHNIFLVRQTFKLGDFGVSLIKDDNLTTKATMVGTYGYMAPEIFDTSTSYDKITNQNDIFSFGCTMFQIISGGMLPFGLIKDRTDIKNYIYNSKKGIFRSLRNFRKDIPVYWEDIILKCLQPQPSERYQSVMEIKKALASYVAESQNNMAKDALGKKYDYDLFFSFAEADKLIAIEIYSYLDNKGLKVLMSNQLFDENFIATQKASKPIHEICKHFLLLHSKQNTELSANEFMIGFQKNHHENSQKVIIYNTLVDSEKDQQFSKEHFVIHTKKDILNAIGIGELFANRHFVGEEQESQDRDKKIAIKSDILTLVAHNKLKKAIKVFYDYLKGLEHNEEVLESVLLISSRFKRYEKEKSLGIESFDTLNREENRIILSLNKLVLDYF